MRTKTTEKRYVTQGNAGGCRGDRGETRGTFGQFLLDIKGLVRPVAISFDISVVIMYASSFIRFMDSFNFF